MKPLLSVLYFIVLMSFLMSSYGQFTEEDGLAGNFDYGIADVNKANVWVCAQEYSRFNSVDSNVRDYWRDEHLQASEIMELSYFVPNGEFVYEEVKALNSLYPDKIVENPVMSDIIITDCKVIDESGISDIPIGKMTSHIQIHYDQTLILYFGSPASTKSSNVDYKYSLQELGKPEKWINIGKERSLTISNLVSGEYVFKVTKSDRDGVWIPEGANLRILVEAPFWNTRVAYILYFVLLQLIFYLLIQSRLNVLRRSNRLLKEREWGAREISKQKELLSKRNKDIEDSLKYAHRIQSAILNTPKLFKKHLPNSFILHRPKDIVSGDFYWISEKDDYLYVAVVDCTGHGVPGAFMSVISFELFRSVINNQDIRDPGEFLDVLNENFENIFGVNNEISLRDGMDISLCVFKKDEMLLRYAGAFNPLYIVRNNSLIEVKGDRMSIGADHDPVLGQFGKKFTSHTLKLESNDMIYLFTDGYADQFGGPEGKKYKYRRFRHFLLTIHQLSIERQKIFLNDSIEEWMGSMDQIDDILVIGIKANFD